MTNDSLLFTECLDTFKKLKNWVDPDYYRVNIHPVVNKLKDRLAVVPVNLPPVSNTDEFDEREPTTIPDSLSEVITGFGIFDFKK